MAKPIIFLDIDGPMIPGYMWVFKSNSTINPSFGRIFSPTCVEIINNLCDKSNAQIVFNSYHNATEQTVLEPKLIKELDGSERWTSGILEENIKEAAIRNKIEPEFIHEDYKTLYPNPNDRLLAIRIWLNNHLDYDPENWIAFDDSDFKHKNLILINYNDGILLEHYNKAAFILGIEGWKGY